MKGLDDWITREPVSYADEECQGCCRRGCECGWADERDEYDPEDAMERAEFWREYDRER